MSREIIEAVKTIEREKGIEEDTLINALEDALLAAYKKTPGSSRHATVELDTESGDFRVFSIELPADIEERLIEEARERAIEELEAQEAETGEHSHVLISDDDLQIDWSDVDPAVVGVVTEVRRHEAVGRQRIIVQRVDEVASGRSSHWDVVLLARSPVRAVPHVDRRIVLRSVRGAAVRAVATHPLGEGALGASGGPYLAEDVADSDRYR